MGTLVGNISNRSFETPGSDYGKAESWTEAYSTAAEAVARFEKHEGTQVPYEDFEDDWWNNHEYLTAFGIQDLLKLYFCDESLLQESFHTGWFAPGAIAGTTHNGYSESEFSAGNFSAVQYIDTSYVESFENTWGVSPWNEDSIDDYSDGSFTAASFDPIAPENVEDFEEYWQNNQTYDTAFALNGADAALTVCIFTGALNYENFEGTWVSVLL